MSTTDTPNFQPDPDVDEFGRCVECRNEVAWFKQYGWICDDDCPAYREAARQEDEAWEAYLEGQKPDTTTLLGRLEAAKLAAAPFRATDGHMSVAVRSDKEAAQLAYEVFAQWVQEHGLDGGL